MFARGDKCYILENGRMIKEAKVVNKCGEFCTIQTVGSCGAIRLRESKLFHTKEEIEAYIASKHRAISEPMHDFIDQYADPFLGRRVNRSPHRL